MNKSVLSLPDRYGGLFHMALQISAYIPKSKYYIEPFSGLARTAKYARSQIIVLNDKSLGANKKCKKIVACDFFSDPPINLMEESIYFSNEKPEELL